MTYIVKAYNSQALRDFDIDLKKSLLEPNRSRVIRANNGIDILNEMSHKF